MGRDWRGLSSEMIEPDLNFKWITFAAVLRVDCRVWARMEWGEGEGDRQKVILACMRRVTVVEIMGSG